MNVWWEPYHMTELQQKLNQIRIPAQSPRRKALIGVVITLVSGVILGVFSKWLDNLPLDSTIWWHRLLEKLDLGNFFSEFAIWMLIALILAVFSASALRAALNVFAFFAGMCAAYHLYTILFSGFNPVSYMMIWYGITLVSPFLAVICWYAKGEGPVSVILDILIIAAFSLSCFGIGLFYISSRGVLYLLVFVGSVLVLYQNPRRLLITLPVGFFLSFLLSPIWPYR